MNKRACDACAIRKIRCSPVKPCLHCIQNSLTCTSLRERKKSGPKNLQRKTLENIDNLVKQPKSIINSSIDVKDLLGLIGKPQIYELIEPLTVASILSELDSLIKAVDSPDNGALQLSLCATAYSLSLLIIETVLKIGEMPIPMNLLQKPISYYRNLKPGILLKTSELLLLIESEIRLGETAIDPTVLYYNSLSCAHVYTYYRIGPNPQAFRVNRFLHLRHAVSCFQLIESENTSCKLSYGKVFELYEYLYILERMNYFLLDKGQISAPVLTNDLNMEASKSFDSKNQLFSLLKTIEPNLPILRFFNYNHILTGNFQTQEFLDYCQQYKVTSKMLSQVIPSLESCESKSDTVYSSYMLLFNTLVSMKVDLAQSILQNKQFTIPSTILQLIVRANIIFQNTNTATLAVRATHGHLLPQLFIMLYLGIEKCVHQSSDRKILKEFSINLLALSPQGHTIDPYVRLSPRLQKWFLSLSTESALPPFTTENPFPSNLKDSIPNSDFANFPMHLNDNLTFTNSQPVSETSTVPPSLISNTDSPPSEPINTYEPTIYKKIKSVNLGDDNIDQMFSYYNNQGMEPIVHHNLE